MTYFQSNNNILIISNDSFIIGLLTGYCIANHFTLKCISRSIPIETNGLNPSIKVIITDLRELPSHLIESHLTQLKHINQTSSVPICAIHNHCPMQFCLKFPWVDYYRDDSFIDKFDNSINRYMTNFVHAFLERRNFSRRLGLDRRSAVDSDRRLILGPLTDTLHGKVNAFSSKQINRETSFLDTQIENKFLGVFEIDKDCQRIYLKGKDLELTTKEFKLFNLLAESPEQVCTKEEIIKSLWPDKSRANKSDLYQYMHLLRRKVELDPDNPRWIQTIKGVGYKLHI